jgi:hypothetical protein
VTADSDRAFRDQALFAGFFAADVVSDFVLKRDERVRNDLFVGRIDLSFCAREKEILSTREKRIEIFLRLEVEAVKSPKFVEQAAPDDEHVFLSRLHRHCHSERSEAATQRTESARPGFPSLVIFTQTGKTMSRDL